MATGFYAKYLEYALNMTLGAGGSPSNPVVKAVLVDTADYSVDLATHEFLSDIPSGARENTSAALSSKTFTGGVFDAADAVFSAETGDTSEALVLVIDTGSEGTSRLVAYIDSATGLPLTPNGADVNLVWDSGSNKIFKLA